jgi:hypothetical protein
MTKPPLTIDQKTALVIRAFQTEQGTWALYAAAHMEAPAQLAPTAEGRFEEFRRAMPN